jgi:hypothetical protein
VQRHLEPGVTEIGGFHDSLSRRMSRYYRTPPQCSKWRITE